MGKTVLVVLVLLSGCASVHRIPAPEPAPSAGAPAQSLSLYTRAMVGLAAGDLDSARRDLERARVYDSEATAILVALARLEMTAGDLDKARGLYADAVEIAESDADVWLERGRLELAFGDADLGRNSLERSEQLGDPWEARARLIADAIHRKRVPAGLEAWSARPVSDPVELRVRADLRVGAGDGAGGLEDYLSVLENQGADVSLVGPVVRTAVRADRVARTLMHMDRLLRVQPDSRAARAAAGVLSGLIGDHAAAVDLLDELTMSGVDDSTISSALERSRKALQAPIHQPPRGSVPLGDPVNRAISAVESGRWADAEQAIDDGLSVSANDARLLYIRSQLVLKRDGESAAFPHVERVLEFHPGYVPALNLWAWIQSQAGVELDRAEQRARRVLDQQPEIGAYWDTLGWILHLTDDHRSAEAALARALRLSPKDDTVREHLERCRNEEQP